MFGVEYDIISRRILFQAKTWKELLSEHRVELEAAEKGRSHKPTDWRTVPGVIDTSGGSTGTGILHRDEDDMDESEFIIRREGPRSPGHPVHPLPVPEPPEHPEDPDHTRDMDL